MDATEPLKIRTHADRLADALQDERAAERETSYRRGYAHGYSQAMDDLQRGCRRDLWERVAGFFDDVLMAWRYRRDRDRSWMPPAFKDRKP
jgi:hypothetical protein